MFINQHILKFEEHTWLMALTGDDERLICAYLFDTERDAESAAEIAIGVADEPRLKDITYPELIRHMSAIAKQLLADKTMRR